MVWGTICPRGVLIPLTSNIVNFPGKNFQLNLAHETAGVNNPFEEPQKKVLGGKRILKNHENSRFLNLQDNRLLIFPAYGHY